MRRIIRQIASKTITTKAELGDLTTLANPEVIDELFMTLVTKLNNDNIP